MAAWGLVGRGVVGVRGQGWSCGGGLGGLGLLSVGVPGCQVAPGSARMRLSARV